ncbi:MAG: DUF4258 domain-containing protein [SAR324 cluster bacterium]
MEFRLTRHVREELLNRAIPEHLLNAVLEYPQQVVRQPDGRQAYQSLFDFGGGKLYLLRAIVEDTTDPAAVVTIYRTGKVGKYWRDHESDL